MLHSDAAVRFRGRQFNCCMGKRIFIDLPSCQERVKLRAGLLARACLSYGCSFTTLSKLIWFHLLLG